MGHKIVEIRESLIEMAKKAKKISEETNDLKATLVAVKAYSEAVRTSVVQVHYKRLTGTPSRIAFLEE
jgi:hypothetical protein